MEQEGRDWVRNREGDREVQNGDLGAQPHEARNKTEDGSDMMSGREKKKGKGKKKMCVTRKGVDRSLEQASREEEKKG